MCCVIENQKKRDILRAWDSYREQVRLQQMRIKKALRRAVILFQIFRGCVTYFENKRIQQASAAQQISLVKSYVLKKKKNIPQTKKGIKSC